MNESEQLLVNELRRIERAVEKRQKVLESLADKKKISNRRYVLDLPVELGLVTPPVSPLYSISDAPVSRSFVIDRDCTYFFCKEMVYTCSLVGQITLPNQESVQGKFSVPNTSYLWFSWQVRDTYTDRTWSNLPVPDFAMGSGKTSGLLLGRPAMLPAGTEIVFTAYPVPALEPLEFLRPTSFSIQVSFVGFEVL